MSFLGRFLNLSLKHKNARGNHTRANILYGGDKEDRTPDLLHAMQALSLLSYAPVAVLTTINSIEESSGFVKGNFLRKR